jgi:hypothetical protein
VLNGRIDAVHILWIEPVYEAGARSATVLGRASGQGNR